MINKKELHEIEETWSKCTLCPKLSKARDNNKQKIAFGTGYSDAIGLLITETPYVGLEKETESWEILNKIWQKQGIDERDWFITSSIVCPNSVAPTMNEIVNCRQRLSEIMYTISPAIVVLLGYESHISFFGGSADKDSGYKKLDHYETYFSHGVSNYLRERTSDKARAQLMAQEMFADWGQIATTINAIKSE